jgi:outer membrane receptor protein involved in Fe transport
VLTVKTGIEGTYQVNRSLSTENFGGTFTFPSLEAYRQGAALTYRVNRGNPLLEMGQWELAGFVQNDLVLTPQLTLMFGARYDLQSNLADRNNLSPRLGFAYGLGRATVIRGGVGLFYIALPFEQVETQRRLDGTRQFEVIIDNASYPDPSSSGRVRQTFPSIRLLDPELVNPETAVSMLSVERTFPRNLFVAATYEFKREWHMFRLRNLNAPFDATASVRRSCRPEQSAETCIRPDPGRGNLVTLESTGWGFAHALRLRVRQRVGIFNLSANYLLDRAKNNGSPLAAALPTDNYDARADYANRIQPRHTVDGSINARAPFGVFLTTTLSANTGRYYNITTGRDDNRDTTINDRPPGVSRNSAKAPGYFNVNFNIAKAFFLGGAGSAGVRKNINVFANMINAFNWVHYGLPSGVLTSPNFGRSTSAEDPREIEIGVRFQF